ncbi:hypothetical protein R1flu_015005 [Riccia fluitans]|uniref:sulfiredoxin n=1 Tax=Riccia fluitans TaxID=41844 RepID=A0ABD1YHP8_9MARC
MFSSAAAISSAPFPSVVFTSKNSNSPLLALKCSQNGSSAPPAGDQDGAASGKAAKGPKIIELPLEKIRRPLLRTRNNDPEKVKDLMASISEIGLLEPIDVLEVEGVYYGFSGCHRYEAHRKLGLPTIRCKVRKGTKDTLRHHLR